MSSHAALRCWLWLAGACVLGCQLGGTPIIVTDNEPDVGLVGEPFRGDVRDGGTGTPPTEPPGSAPPTTDPPPTPTPPTPTPPTPTPPTPTPPTPTPPTPTPPTPTPPNPSGCGEGIEAEAFALLLAERAQSGLAELTCDPVALEVVRRHSRDMCDRGFFDHTNPDGQDPFDRLRAGGVQFGAGGENIAAGYPTPAAVHEGWMNSAGHRRNMLGSGWRRAAIGAYTCERGDFGVYWTEAFMD